jgi:hypothetical protein
MTLGDLRKLAIRKQLKIRFPLRNGMECVIGEDGVARIPSLKSQPDFTLEQEFAETAAFTLEPAAVPGRKSRSDSAPRSLSRAELAALTSESPATVAVHDEHDDE